jgi:hypothetical protein
MNLSFERPSRTRQNVVKGAGPILFRLILASEVFPRGGLRMANIRRCISRAGKDAAAASGLNLTLRNNLRCGTFLSHTVRTTHS